MTWPQLPDYYPLVVDSVFCDGNCADCGARIPAGAMMGTRPMVGYPGAAYVLCKSCVHKELARRATWVRDVWVPSEAKRRADYLAGKRDDE